MKKTLTFILIAVIILFILAAAFISQALKKDFIPLTDGMGIGKDWEVNFQQNDTRKDIYLVNKTTNESYLLTSYLLYSTPDDFKGKIYSEDGKDFLVTEYNNEGSADVLYYSVYKLSEDGSSLEKLNKEMIWACGEPELNSEGQLSFFGENLQDFNCTYFFSKIPFNKKPLGMVDLK